MPSGPDYHAADELADEARADINRDEAQQEITTSGYLLTRDTCGRLWVVLTHGGASHAAAPLSDSTARDLARSLLEMTGDG